jgi:hypothetical protein
VNLESLAARAWSIFRDAQRDLPEVVVEPSMPILFFGDSEAYERSALKVATVGLNPSRREFPSNDPWLRFPEAAALSVNGSFGPDAGADYLRFLNDYFRAQPYRGWFDAGFEPILRGLGASYYTGAESVALHTDLCSPIATDPTWTRLGVHAAKLSREGVELWRDLIDALAPDVLLVSVASRYLSHIAPEPIAQWRVLHTVERTNPFHVLVTEAQIGRRQIPVVFGRAAELPLGTVSHVAKAEIGASIRTFLDGR